MPLEHPAKCDRVLAKALPDAPRWDEAWKGLKLEAFSNLSLSHYLKLFTPALTNYLDILVFIWSIFHAPSEFLFGMMVILVGRGSAHSVVVLMSPDDSGARGRVQIGGKGQRTPLRGEGSRWGEKVVGEGRVGADDCGRARAGRSYQRASVSCWALETILPVHQPRSMAMSGALCLRCLSTFLARNHWARCKIAIERENDMKHY